jgi:hypothetical protein
LVPASTAPVAVIVSGDAYLYIGGGALTVLSSIPRAMVVVIDDIGGPAFPVPSDMPLYTENPAAYGEVPETSTTFSGGTFSAASRQPFRDCRHHGFPVAAGRLPKQAPGVRGRRRRDLH